MMFPPVATSVDGKILLSAPPFRSIWPETPWPATITGRSVTPPPPPGVTAAAVMRTDCVPHTEPTHAVAVAVPAAIPVTVPSDPTFRMPGSLDVHVTAASTTVPLASRGTATSLSVLFAHTDVAADRIVTLATVVVVRRSTHTSLTYCEAPRLPPKTTMRPCCGEYAAACAERAAGRGDEFCAYDVHVPLVPDVVSVQVSLRVKLSVPAPPKITSRVL